MSIYLLDEESCILDWMDGGMSQEEAEEKAADLFTDDNEVLLKDCRCHYQDNQIFTTAEFKDELEEDYNIEFIEKTLG